MRAFFLSFAMLATGAAAGAAIDQNRVEGLDLRVLGRDIPAAHKEQWKAESALYRRCPTCLPSQPFPNDSLN